MLRKRYQALALRAIHIRVPGEPGNEASLCTHHSYIIQEEDTCIHRAGAQWKGEKGDLFAQIEFFHSCTICDITVTSFRRRIIAFTR